MSARFVLSAPAASDVDELLEYLLEQSGPQAARRVAERLHRVFRRLAEIPGLGHKREDLTAAQVAFKSVWSYLVIYKPETAPLEIVRVLHGARDIRRLLENLG